MNEIKKYWYLIVIIIILLLFKKKNKTDEELQQDVFDKDFGTINDKHTNIIVGNKNKYNDVLDFQKEFNALMRNYYDDPQNNIYYDQFSDVLKSYIDIGFKKYGSKNVLKEDGIFGKYTQMAQNLVFLSNNNMQYFRGKKVLDEQIDILHNNIFWTDNNTIS